LINPQGHTIGGRPIHAIGFEVAGQSGAPVTQRTRRGDGRAHGRLLDIGRDDPDVAETGCHFRERSDAGAVNTVVVADKNAPFHYSIKRVCAQSWTRRSRK